MLRFGRVYPLHFFMLIVWLPIILAKAYVYHQLGSGSQDPFINNNLITFLSNVFLMNSLGLHNDISWNYPAWSISVEFATYLVFFVFASKFKYSEKSISLLLMSCISYGYLFMISEDTLLRTFDYGIFRCVGGFFLGAFIYTISKNKHFNLNHLTSSVIEIVIVVISLALVMYSGAGKLFELLSFASFSILIFIFTTQNRGVLSYILETKIMLWLGSLSYSIYMVHALVFAVFTVIWQFYLKLPTTFLENESGEQVKFFDTPYSFLINLLALMIIIAISSFTYAYVEKPWRDRIRKTINNQ
jgi:peptidoglycan/LPS O-acetylase OafA/YrhL